MVIALGMRYHMKIDPNMTTVIKPPRGIPAAMHSNICLHKGQRHQPVKFNESLLTAEIVHKQVPRGTEVHYVNDKINI